MDFHHIRKVIQTEHTLLENEWKGAVLFLCNDEYVFFIKRSEDMPTHSGQLGFIGGHKNIAETDPWEVAQREFEEETQLDRVVIEFLGFLPAVLTARLQPIIPVLARLLISSDDLFRHAVSNGEWDDLIAYPWSELVKEENWEFAWRHGNSKGPVLFHPLQKGNL